MIQTVAAYEEVITISPKPKMVSFRKRLLILQWAVFLVNLLLVILEVIAKEGALALANAITCLMLALVIRLVRNQTNRPQVKPMIQLTPGGLIVDGVPPLGPLPWNEIAAVRPRRFLGVPTVHLTLRDRKTVRSRIGDAGKYLWLYKIPNGELSLSCIPFGLAPKDLAAQIEEYRLRHDETY